MNRTTLAGLALVAASVTGLLSSELVTSAHAGRSDGKAYLLAISTGGQLRLEGRPSAASGGSAGGGMVATVGVTAVPTAGVDSPRRMLCRSVVELAAVSVGYGCRQV